jgi:hypothetical protein
VYDSRHRLLAVLEGSQLPLAVAWRLGLADAPSGDRGAAQPGAATGSSSLVADISSGSLGTTAAPPSPRTGVRRAGVVNGTNVLLASQLDAALLQRDQPQQQQPQQHQLVDTHVVMGTSTGYVLFCDTSRKGLQVGSSS